nr:hypothetical protein [Candidatus Sigynarchaeum springense]
ILLAGSVVSVISITYFKQDPRVRGKKYRVIVIFSSASILLLTTYMAFILVAYRVLMIDNIEHVLYSTDNPLGCLLAFLLWSAIALLIVLIPVVLISAAL